ncbi:hypothetical protein FB45DRAFT_933803 [Roridomyces roridus]|uniref:F-box domain-containing protein n=1 Tax=Roridomyces roridus TaxID=1738132 RepID=A0AAD7BD19_9AGAR|nr:hypothetical protein FB45DRAFT_933803 [Roridomyces roridus]
MESPFQDIIHTNAVPTEEQSGRIHDLVSSSQKQAQVLTAEINRLESLLDDLLEKRNQLTDFIDAHLALVSPARRTPDDVVREIFIAALPSDFPATLSGTAAPLLLCHISQKWRALALSTPRLWTSLHVIPHPSIRSTRVLNPNLGTSPTRPISPPTKLSFALSSNFPPAGNHSDSEYPDYFDLGSIVDVLPAQLPLLRSASIDSPATEDQFAFLNTNTLTALSFRITAEIPMPSIFWSTIRHLSFLRPDMSSPSCANAPSSKPAPSAYTGARWRTRASPCCSTTYGTSKSRTLLTVAKFHPVFRTLIAPNLCLLRYMDESGPPKHSLPIFPIVASSKPGPILCPRLQKLALLNFSALSDDTLLHFILARTDPKIVHSPMACLERVRAYFRRTQQIDLAALPSIQECVAAGLELRLEYLPPPFVSYKVWEGNQGYRQWDPACKVWGAALESEESWTRRR